jgi:hypothetical protein
MNGTGGISKITCAGLVEGKEFEKSNFSPYSTAK